MDNSGSKPHAVLLASPGLGHLIPILELGKRLSTLHNFGITIFVVASQTSAAESEIIKAAMSPNIREAIIELSPPDISGLVDPDAAVATILAVIMREIRPALRSAISGLKSRPTVLIVDLFGTESLAIGNELGIPKYLFIASNAWFLALTVYIPTLDKLIQGEYVDQKEPFNIPGCKSVRPEDMVAPMLDRTDQQYFECVRSAKEMQLSDGILINTWEDLEPITLEALRNGRLLGRIIKASIYTVGPMVRPVAHSCSKIELFDWLDKQPGESVLYISLGSGGTLSCEQMNELAWGLELSQQRFIWVVRLPTAKSRDGTFFTVGNVGDDFSSFLPDGFLRRTQNIGVVVPQWAPQVNILRHLSIGGCFLHGGWNSTLECIANGVPMIVCPLYAEQRMNAILLKEELGVAIRSKILPSEGVVGREEIKIMVEQIMVNEEGYKIRTRVKKFQQSAEKAWSEGGSSYNSLSVFVKECEMSKINAKK